jgi:hypothetical protein
VLIAYIASGASGAFLTLGGCFLGYRCAQQWNLQPDDADA